jgi:predicted homoserine dehydrogenase-like protein
MYIDELKRLESTKRPIKIGLVGLGAMGKGIAYNVCHTPGMKLAMVGDINEERIKETKALLPEFDFETAECLEVAESNIDIFIEASSSIEDGYLYSRAAIESGNDLLLMNGEVDCFFGPELFELAKEKNVVYSSTDGDQYGVLIKMIEETDLMGLRTIMIGNIKGFLNRYATPDSIIEEARIRNLDPQMCVTYTDGTKLAIEMAILSNATGSVPYKGRMEGPKMKDVHEVLKYYDFAAISKEPCVEYILGAEPNGGVFTVVECHNDYQRSMLKYYKMGDGPYYLMYRPYHLCHLETVFSICRVYLDRKPLMAPYAGRVSNVMAVAKRDLNPGDKLDQPGQFTVYGEVALQSDIDTNEWIVINDVDGMVVKNRIAKDSPICLDDLNED